MKQQGLSKRDILQVRAFHAAYKLNHHLPKTERFVQSICETSDELFNIADRTKVKEWELSYYKRGIV